MWIYSEKNIPVRGNSKCKGPLMEDRCGRCIWREGRRLEMDQRGKRSSRLLWTMRRTYGLILSKTEAILGREKQYGLAYVSKDDVALVEKENYRQVSWKQENQ